LVTGELGGVANIPELPPGKAAEARKKRKLEAKKRKRLKPGTLFLVGWMLLITNLPMQSHNP
jgi:hypothetical protein